MPMLVLSGLNNPTGVGVLGDGRVLVVESGAGRIVIPGDDGSVSVFAEGFATGSFLPFEIGPLSVLVHPDGSVIVGEGGGTIGTERVSFFGSDGVAMGERTIVPPGGGNFFGMALHPATGSLFVASANTNEIFEVAVGEGGFGQVTSFVENTAAPPIGFAAPTGLAFEADGSLIVGFGEIGGAGIVRLSTADQSADESVGLVSFVLYETDRLVTSVAVRANDGTVLFTETAFDASGTTGGRIGMILSDGSVETFLDGLAGPSALAIGSDGTLFVTELGATPNGASGSLSRIETDSQNDVPAIPTPPATPPSDNGAPS